MEMVEVTNRIRNMIHEKICMPFNGGVQPFLRRKFAGLSQPHMVVAADGGLALASSFDKSHAGNERALL